MFVNHAEFLPQQPCPAAAAGKIISAAEAAGHARVAEMNQQVAGTWTRSSRRLEDEGTGENSRPRAS